MIFGKTYNEEYTERRTKQYLSTFPKARFAILPTRMTNGRYVWLQYYHEHTKYIERNDKHQLADIYYENGKPIKVRYVKG